MHSFYMVNFYIFGCQYGNGIFWNIKSAYCQIIVSFIATEAGRAVAWHGAAIPIIACVYIRFASAFQVNGNYIAITQLAAKDYIKQLFFANISIIIIFRLYFRGFICWVV